MGHDSRDSRRGDACIRNFAVYFITVQAVKGLFGAAVQRECSLALANELWVLPVARASLSALCTSICDGERSSGDGMKEPVRHWNARTTRGGSPQCATSAVRNKPRTSSLITTSGRLKATRTFTCGGLRNSSLGMLVLVLDSLDSVSVAPIGASPRKKKGLAGPDRRVFSDLQFISQVVCSPVDTHCSRNHLHQCM